MATEERTSSSASPDTIISLPNNIAVRRYHPNDIPSLAHNGNSKPLWNNLRNRMPHPYTEEAAAFWVNLASEPSSHIRSGPWEAETGSSGPAIPVNYAITINDTAVGSIGLIFGESHEVYARSAELGYWVGETYWGRGIMGAIVPAFVEWTWRTFGILVRLETAVFEGNVGSRKCLEKAGFVVEGVKKWAYVKNGIIGHEIIMGAIRPGFEGE